LEGPDGDHETTVTKKCKAPEGQTLQIISTILDKMLPLGLMLTFEFARVNTEFSLSLG
jgi:hypothetical protein